MRDVEVDVASPEFKADPCPFFARLRETAPVSRVTLPGRQTAWLITRYDDVAAALKDGRFAKDRNNALTPDQTARQPREDIPIGGVVIPRGEMVYAVLASANRDPRQFPDPDTLDVAREPNRHLTFGLGIHYCLGAPLARLEGEIAITALLRRAPGLRLSVQPGELRWRRGLVLRGLESLPVILD